MRFKTILQNPELSWLMLGGILLFLVNKVASEHTFGKKGYCVTIYVRELDEWKVRTGHWR
ncbi:MAG TPA: hypothetical protein VFO40_01730 [Chthoniobacterales bacterium]|nr:hypothetical protein [Chthoniobacterales bacterium]